MVGEKDKNPLTDTERPSRDTVKNMKNKSPRLPGGNTKSSLLTPKQRDYILNSSDIDSKSPEERAVRRRIRERLIIGIRDLAIAGGLEKRDLKTVFEEPDIFNQFDQAFGTLLLGASLGAQHEIQDTELNDKLIDMYEDLYEGGLENVYNRCGVVVNEVSVSIDIDLEKEVSESQQRDYDDLSLDELHVLLSSGRITREEFSEYVIRIAERAGDEGEQ